MAKKLKLTRPELKRWRDTLRRYRRYLPMLKLKQQLLQARQREVDRQRRAKLADRDAAMSAFASYEAVLADLAGLPVRKLAAPLEVVTSTVNVAGASLPIFQEVRFAEPRYSLFGTPAWVDQALADLRGINRLQAEMEVLQKQFDLLTRELNRVMQRVNLFEKVKIPEAQEAIRVIRIKLGDEMTAAVGRAKIAKGKLAAAEGSHTGEAANGDAAGTDEADAGEDRPA